MAHTTKFWATDGFLILVFGFPVLLFLAAFLFRHGWGVFVGALIVPFSLFLLPITHCWTYDCDSTIARFGQVIETTFDLIGCAAGALLGLAVRSMAMYPAKYH